MSTERYELWSSDWQYLSYTARLNTVHERINEFEANQTMTVSPLPSTTAGLSTLQVSTTRKPFPEACLECALKNTSEI